ncbi:MAG TPA: aminodeoxychorismate synthase component I [Chiayiivirga sp.]|nr:aminodeoxychorismate synthase component I [Chiayiivirga sp.]
MVALKLAGEIDLLALHRGNRKRYPLLLESSAFEATRGRHDVLLGEVQGGLRLDRDGHTRDLNGAVCEGAFADLLDAALRAEPETHTPQPQPPFVPRWGLFVSYEFAGVVESVLDLPEATEPLPLALALRCAVAVIVDRVEGITWLVADDAVQLAQLQANLQTMVVLEHEAAPRVRTMHEEPAERYLAAVKRALDYLAAGDVFQINLSRRWQLELAEGTRADVIFAALRRANPAPFAALLAWEDWAIISSSPERLVSVHGDVIETRPIAGTRPRLQGEDEAARIRELIGHPKERAEHVMLIDLERNDLGRICTPGSVEVNELMVVESYAHVHHIVSNVRGRLCAGTTPGAVLRAVFPGGSITGCPKVRCMQLIAELEGEGRGAYTGALGWLGAGGAMDLNILIRSLTLHDGRASFRAGAGIVADSQPEAELAETRAKARGLLRALGLPD